MGEHLVVEAPGRRKPLLTLPRARKDTNGDPIPPLVEVDLDWGRRAAGCVICNNPIPPDTTRLSIRVWLRDPVIEPNGQRRLTERYFAHPGCLTDKIRPEVIRSRMSCYDCGRLPEQRSDTGLIHFADRCFTVSKFAAAPLCALCRVKPSWRQCEACLVFFPHWMISETSESRDSVPAAHMSQYMDLAIAPASNICEYCANRLHIPTVVQTESAKADFEKLRRDIAEHGIFEAGE